MKKLRIVAVASLSMAVVTLLPGAASASTQQDTDGVVSTDPNKLKYTGDYFPTVSKTGNITIDYTNAIGGYAPVYMRLCKPRTLECFADTRTLTTKKRYTLGTNVLKGTRFVIQYRAPEGVPNDNTYWAGIVTVP